jgi:TRAP-type C4-dicarboxylate transport system permease small subunit
MNRKDSLLELLDTYLNQFFLIIGGLAALSLMALATGNVLLRIFRLPYGGAYEIISFLGAVVIASALGYTQKNKDHIVVEIITEKYSCKLRALVELFASLLMALFFAVVSWRIYIWGMRIWKSGEVSETLKFAYHPFVFFVAAGFAMAFLSAIFEVFRQVSGLRVKRP